MDAKPKPKILENVDRIATTHTETTASKILDKLPIILEEGATSSSDAVSSEFCDIFKVNIKDLI